MFQNRSRIRLEHTALIALLFLSTFGTKNTVAQTLSVEDYLEFPTAKADHRISYGKEELQFGDLWLPESEGPHPVAIVLHGGCWRAKYDLEPISGFCATLSQEGLAVWSLEYRRVDNEGGGWPGTFKDVAMGADFVRELATSYSLDLDRVVTVGHSAGGHLGLWLAARPQLPQGSILYSKNPLRLQGVVALAGVVDLRGAIEGGVCGDATAALAGGLPEDVPMHYAQGSPIELLPLNVPQHHLIGAKDDPALIKVVRGYVAAAEKAGDDVELTIFDHASHFEIVAPTTKEWSVVRDTVLSLIRAD